MKRKKAALCAAMLMAVCVMASCQSKQKPPSDTISVDLQGYEFVWATPWYWNNYPTAGSTEFGDLVLARYEELKNKYGVTIVNKDVNPESYYEDVQRAMYSGDKFADFFETDYLRWLIHAKTGALMDLNSIKGFDPKQEKFFKTTSETHTLDGVLTALQYNLFSTPTGVMLFFNKDLLADQGCENPYDLVESNNWTFASFEAICKKLTKDTDSDNELDMFGFGGGSWHGNSWEKPIIFSNGGQIIRKGSNGKYQFALLENSAQEALNFMARIDFGQKYKAPAGGDEELFKRGRVGFLFASLESIPSLNANMSDDWGLVPVPKGPNASQYVGLDINHRAWCMLKTNKDAQKAAAVFDLITNPLSGSLKSDKELYDESYLNNFLNGDEKALEMIKLVQKNTVADEGWGIGAEEDIGLAISACVSQNSKTPKQAMQQIQNIVQGYIDSFFYGTGAQEIADKAVSK